jgi:hypothetical protein
MTTPETPQKRGSNKIWLWVGLGCGGTLLLAGLLLAGVLFYAWRTFNFSMSPQKAEETARSIMNYEIPGGSVGIMSMDFQGVQFAGVLSAENPEAVILVVGKVSPSAQGAGEEDFQQAFEEGLDSQRPEINVQSTRTEERSLCNETVTLAISEGEQETFGQPNQPATVYQTTVNYNDFLYFVSLTTTGTDAESVAEQVFESLDCQ